MCVWCFFPYSSLRFTKLSSLFWVFCVRVWCIWQTIIDNLFKRRILSPSKLRAFDARWTALSLLQSFISIWIQYRISTRLLLLLLLLKYFFFLLVLSLSLVFLLPFEMLEFFSSVCHQLWAVNFKCDCVSDIFWVYHQVQLQHTAREPDILDSTILLWNRWNVYLNERSELRCCARTMWLSMLIYPYRTGFYNVQFGLGIQFFRTVFK